MSYKKFIFLLGLAFFACKTVEPIEISPLAIENVHQAERLNAQAAQAFYNENHTEAIDLWSQAIALDEGNVDYYLNRAVAYIDTQDFLGAEADLESVLSTTSEQGKKAVAYNYLGLTKLLEKEYSTAVELLKKAITNDRSYASPHYHLALCYDAVGLKTDAIHSITRAIKLDNNEGLYYLNRGNLYEDTKKYREAIKDYLYAYDLDETNVSPLLSVAACYIRIKNYGATEDMLLQVLKIAPNNFDALYGLSELYFNYLNNQRMADSYVEKAIANAMVVDDQQKAIALRQQISAKKTRNYRP